VRFDVKVDHLGVAALSRYSRPRAALTTTSCSASHLAPWHPPCSWWCLNPCQSGFATLSLVPLQEQAVVVLLLEGAMVS
jgi:hypothetical protein